MKPMFAIGFCLGCVTGIALFAVGDRAAHAELVIRISPPVPAIAPSIKLDSPPYTKWTKLDSVVRLYGPDGHPIREYEGALSQIEQFPGGVRFKLENGRAVTVGGTFSVEEIPHQEAP